MASNDIKMREEIAREAQKALEEQAFKSEIRSTKLSQANSQKRRIEEFKRSKLQVVRLLKQQKEQDAVSYRDTLISH